MNTPNISPKDHPNTYVGGGTAALMGFIVSECKQRFGFDITAEEAGWIIAGVTSAVLFASHRLGGKP